MPSYYPLSKIIIRDNRGNIFPPELSRAHKPACAYISRSTTSYPRANFLCREKKKWPRARAVDPPSIIMLIKNLIRSRARAPSDSSFPFFFFLCIHVHRVYSVITRRGTLKSRAGEQTFNETEKKAAAGIREGIRCSRTGDNEDDAARAFPDSVRFACLSVCLFFARPLAACRSAPNAYARVGRRRDKVRFCTRRCWVFFLLGSCYLWDSTWFFMKWWVYGWFLKKLFRGRDLEKFCVLIIWFKDNAGAHEFPVIFYRWNIFLQ